MKSEAIHNITISPGSADGPLPSGSPVGRTIDLFAAHHCHASHTASLAQERASKIAAICGLYGGVSKRSLAIFRSLANRLPMQLIMDGWIGPSMTWKPLVTPARRLLFRLVVSDSHMSEKGFSLWATPIHRDWKDTPGMRIRSKTGRWRLDTFPRQIFWVARQRSAIQTDQRGWLNPEQLCWIMGYPPHWLDCARKVLETQ